LQWAISKVCGNFCLQVCVEAQRKVAAQFKETIKRGGECEMEVQIHCKFPHKNEHSGHGFDEVSLNE
jgi:hypothetical protein